MRINEKTFKTMPTEIKALFTKAPNPEAPEVLACFPDSKVSGAAASGRPAGPSECRTGNTSFDAKKGNGPLHNDAGSAARFFKCCPWTEEEQEARRLYYCAKASQKERYGSKHPTVKPLALFKYLVKLITPPNGVVLDPFAGTGTTGQAAHEEGFDFILIEREPEYIEDIKRRFIKAKMVEAPSGPEADQAGQHQVQLPEASGQD